jgi:hypothetical protein
MDDQQLVGISSKVVFLFSYWLKCGTTQKKVSRLGVARCGME